jgi:DNA-binding transcriptional regulator WhiA
MELFGLDSVTSRDKREGVHTLYLSVFSKNLCSFLENNFGIKPGHKIRNNTLIPKEIIQNNTLSLACLRGLVDTDGSVSRRGRKGVQFTITFDSRNTNLIEQVKQISDRHGLFTFVSQNNFQIGTNSKCKILRYFNVVGSSNLRHIVRFYEWFYNNKTLYQREVADYYQKGFYRDMKFPFKITTQ